jgi:myo-inositol-1(or 4)-monophosphatase
MRFEEWLDFFREIGSRLRRDVLSISGQPEAQREMRAGAGGDVTTFIDQWAEECILDQLLRLQARGENFTLISEELGWKQFGKGGFSLLLDPIDGSLNAKKGIPFFSTSIALIEGGYLSGTRVGYVINLANGDEFWAIQGEGSFCNGKRLQRKNYEKMEILAFEANRPADDLSVLLPLLPHVTRTRCLGSTALDICYTACGFIDLFVIPRSSRSFDFAAGKLILEEAQGVITDLQGKDVGNAPVDLQRKTGLVASASPEIHRQALSMLRGL